MNDVRKRSVAAGYDRISDRYLPWVARIEGDPRDRMLVEFAQRLPGGARVLDLGCGPGVPSTKALAHRFDVIGVDISEAQIGLARESVPEATFIHGDFAEIEFPEASLHGVAAFYSISHVPREEHALLFARIARWLVPGGLFLATLGATDSQHWVGEWLGVPMFFSSHDADTNRALLRGAGLELILDEIVEMREPEGAVTFLWVIARKPVGGTATALATPPARKGFSNVRSHLASLADDIGERRLRVGVPSRASGARSSRPWTGRRI